MDTNKMVEEYIDKHQDWEAELKKLRSLVLDSGLQETIKWGAPVYTLNGKNILGLGAFKSYVGIWFFQGALLEDKFNKLLNAQEGKTKALRQWRFTALDEIEDGLVRAYIEEAIAKHKEGKEIKSAQVQKTTTMPQELEDAFTKNADLKKAFAKFTPYKQKEFVEYVAEAKRPTTRVSRVTKITPLIFDGIGLNDKYR
ncbi:YdeI/OmpD-associated family protein [Aquimarina brevivitae]|uniref:Uncharacterized protein YdeI (YjbR/CyaY-like superfamily) n=1 Tax=Aquimarina brevivitae TaxID=323412 RepID=A0A4Q7P233_9FLAO|nr:DUF1801 domain-containing protein [Aquimarina brevivitae]RZS93637.1 uncharacterized protein YdeI (YjbR/CyaY-like superfamily) [Aquimarina brevivitae]